VSDSLPKIAVLVPFADADRSELARVRAEVERQEGVDAQLVLLDMTRAGDLDVSEHAHVRWMTPSRSRARRRALRETACELIAWHSPSTVMLPGRLRRAFDALQARPEAQLVTCDYYLTGPHGGLIDRSSPACMGEAPGPAWEAGVLLRRAAAEAVRDLEFYPSELELYRRLHGEQRVAHVEEPGFTLPVADYRRSWDESREDGARLVRAGEAHPTGATVTVHLTAERGGEPRWLPCLEALARQDLPAGSFDVQLDADTWTEEGLRATGSLALPFELRRRGSETPAKPESDLIFFAGTNVFPRSGCLRAHLEAHERVEGRAVVSGARVEPLATAGTALGEWAQAWSDPLAGSSREALSLRAGNFSVRRSDLEAIGELACDLGRLCAADLGLRLEASGVGVLHEPAAVAEVAPTHDLETVRATVEALAEATEALLARHPELRSVVSACLPRPAQRDLDDLRALERALEQLGRIDLAAVQDLGPGYAETASGVRAQLNEFMPMLVDHWWSGAAPDASSEPSSAPAAETVVASAGLRARTPSLSVIVPTHDRPEALLQLLDRIGDQDLPTDRFEVIVVDDGSERPAEELYDASRADFELTFLRQAPSGPGVARNLGLQHSRGRYVLFFNDDAVPGSECLRRHLEGQLGRSDGAAVLGSFALLPRHRQDSFSEHVETSLALFAQPRMKAGVLYGGSSFCSGNISIARDTLLGTGGFDESFPYAGGEDSELGLRLEREFGTRVVYDPFARCGHDHALDVRGFASRRSVVGWAAYRIEEKHGDTGLVSLPLADEAAWERLRLQVLEARPEMERLVEHAQTICRCERDAAMGPRSLPKLRPVFEQIAVWGQHLGFLLARDRCRPEPESLARWFERQEAGVTT